MAARMMLAAWVLAISACTVQQSQPLDHGWAPSGACVFVGNRADLHYCATTGTQLLANPAVYDGQLVQVSGWVVAPPDEARQLAMFLTRDAYETTPLMAVSISAVPLNPGLPRTRSAPTRHLLPCQFE